MWSGDFDVDLSVAGGNCLDVEPRGHADALNRHLVRQTKANLATFDRDSFRIQQTPGPTRTALKLQISTRCRGIDVERALGESGMLDAQGEQPLGK